MQRSISSFGFRWAVDALDPCPIGGRLPAAVDIRHGPRGLLGRFFLWADQAARDRGVTLSFASLDDLVAVNRANADTWRPLVPIFDPALGGVTGETAFAFLGRNADGDVVAAQAGRLYLWSATNLQDEATSLRMFYADTAAAAERGDRCEITTPTAGDISGRVLFSGAGWYRPDFRGRGLAAILPRISRAYAYGRWATDWTIALIGEALVKRGVADRYGYTHIEHDTFSFVASPLGLVKGALTWMKSEQLLSDLDTVMQEAATDAAHAAAR